MFWRSVLFFLLISFNHSCLSYEQSCLKEVVIRIAGVTIISTACMVGMLIILGPLDFAIDCDLPRLAKFLISYCKCDVNKGRFWVPLIKAVRNNKIEIVELLLRHPEIDVNEKDIWTPLEKAIMDDKIEIAKLLLSHPSIDVNKEDLWTSLTKAISLKRIKIMKVLLDHPKIESNKRDKFLKTPLEKAIDENFSEGINVLLTHPAVLTQENVILLYENWSSIERSLGDRIGEKRPFDTINTWYTSNSIPFSLGNPIKEMFYKKIMKVTPLAHPYAFYREVKKLLLPEIAQKLTLLYIDIVAPTQQSKKILFQKKLI